MSDTRLESWAQIQPELGKRQLEVLHILQQISSASGHCIARILHRPTYTVLPRITELVEAGLLEDSGSRTWEESTQRYVTLWRRRRTA